MCIARTRKATHLLAGQRCYPRLNHLTRILAARLVMFTFFIIYELGLRSEKCFTSPDKGMPP